ncbi:unnamed protein product [Rotaria socialis]
MAYAAYPSTASSRQVMPARRYQIREKIFSIGDNFKIKDEAGQDVYTVRSKLFSLGDKLVLEDIAGKDFYFYTYMKATGTNNCSFTMADT